MTTPDAVRAFEDAIRKRGIIPPPEGIVADGKIKRCTVEGTPHKKDGSILLFDDPPISGGFQNFRDGIGWEDWTWKNGNGNGSGVRLSAEEVRAAKVRQEKIQQIREQERVDKQKEAAIDARKIWEAAKPAPASHPYLARKKVKPSTVRVRRDGTLIVPMTDETDSLVNLQRIEATGEKRFLPGGIVRGTFSSFGPAPDPSGTIVIVEGVATGLSVHEATGLPVVVAMDADNLSSVSKIFRTRYPEARLVIFADNDVPRNGVSTGIKKATEAAREVGGLIAMSPTPGDDANDLFAREGAAAVRAALDVPFPAPGTAPAENEEPFPDPAPVEPAKVELVSPTGDTPEEPIINSAAPLETAQLFLDVRYQHGGIRTLHFNGGLFYGWRGTHYTLVDEERVKAELYQFLAKALTQVQKKDKSWETVKFNPTRNNVAEVMDALKAAAYHADARPPRWLGECEGSQFPETELIAFDNGVLHVPTGNFLEHSPLFFNVNAVPFSYDPDAAEKAEWDKFTDDLLDDDLQSRDCLQEIFGLLMLPETKYQKIFGIIGPKRSGKGTIARVIRGLLGPENVASPTLASLSSNFGLSNLIGKRCAIISDARLGWRTDQHQIAERLLSISGEDALDIDRKFLTVVSTTLAIRFIIMTNEVPRIEDMSGALPSRFIFLELKESFFGREDLGLTNKLLAELPAIANWAIEGWKRLQSRGHFLQPAAAREVIQQMEDLSSPVQAFVRDCCEVGVGKEIAKQTIFKAYLIWAKEGGRNFTANEVQFGRDLHAATNRKLTSRQPAGDKPGERLRVHVGITLTTGWNDRVNSQERLEQLEDLRRSERAERAGY